MSKIKTILVLALITFDVSAQDSLSSTYVNVGLVPDSLNVIHNAEHLESFYENLFQLKTNNDRKISIIHLGDSHIQADFHTAVVRRRLQIAFGNGGRGMIVPYRVAGTNEPLNFLTSSTVTWTSKRCVFPDLPMPIGVGGITLQTTDPEARLYFYMNDQQWDYAFSKVQVFLEKDSSTFDVILKNTNYEEVGSANRMDSLFTEFRLSTPINGAVIDIAKRSERQQQVNLMGINLENGNNGVIYHAIGVNGAKYIHYLKAKYFVAQTSALTPALIIVALGTNESLDQPYLDKNFEHHIENLVKALSERNSFAKFLFITPQQNLSKGNLNNGVKVIRDSIVKFAVENGYAFWDVYAMTGGNTSPSLWKEKGVLSPDGVHLTRAGYEYTANLLYHALIKGYQDYVSNRHP